MAKGSQADAARLAGERGWDRRRAPRERARVGPDPARAGGQKLRVSETRGKRLDRKIAKKVDLRRFRARRRSKYYSPLTSASVHPDAVTRGRTGGKVALGQFPAGVHLTPSNFPHHAMCRPRGQRSRHDVEPARQTNASDRHAAGTNGQTTGRSQAVECGGEAPSFEALFKASFGALNKASKLIQAVLQKWRRSPPEGPCGSIRGAIGSQRDARTRLQSRLGFLTEEVRPG